MPVDFTAKTKLPSRELSRASTAFHISGLLFTSAIVVIACSISFYLVEFDEAMIGRFG
jgi:hypothetical protein